LPKLSLAEVKVDTADVVLRMSIGKKPAFGQGKGRGTGFKGVSYSFRQAGYCRFGECCERTTEGNRGTKKRGGIPEEENQQRELIILRWVSVVFGFLYHESSVDSVNFGNS